MHLDHGECTMVDNAGRLESGLAWLAGAGVESGAWGYRPGGDRYVEPTALAVVALLSGRDRFADGQRMAELAVSRLVGQQRADGGWGVSPVDSEGSWMTAYAVWSLARARDTLGRTDLADAVNAGVRWLIGNPAQPVGETEREQQRKLMNVDVGLVGWSWSSDTASWVFPTAWSVIAAIAAAPANRGADRVRMGAAYLIDRACADGGWNFGNPYMIGQAYAPTVIDSAAVLLALGAAGESGSPSVQNGLGVLSRLLAGTTSALGLAWGELALTAHGADDTAAGVRDRIAALQQPDGSWNGNPFVTALALLALGRQNLLSEPAR
jgi:hypothetical protein